MAKAVHTIPITQIILDEEIYGYIRISQKPKQPRFSEIQGLALDCNVQI